MKDDENILPHEQIKENIMSLRKPLLARRNEIHKEYSEDEVISIDEFVTKYLELKNKCKQMERKYLKRIGVKYNKAEHNKAKKELDDYIKKYAKLIRLD